MFQENVSIYVQVAEMVENDILMHRLEPENQAPSTNEFAKVYNINPATARKGLNVLVEEGVLYKKRGLGMFVTKDARRIIVAKRKKEFSKNRLPELVNEARRLEMEKEELLEMIEEVWNDTI